MDMIRHRAMIASCAEEANEWKNGDMTIYQREVRVALVKAIEPGTYRMYANVTSTDTDDSTCLFFLHKGDPNATISGSYLQFHRGGDTVIFTISTKATGCAMYASSNYLKSNGDTCVWKDIRIERIR